MAATGDRALDDLVLRHHPRVDAADLEEVAREIDRAEVLILLRLLARGRPTKAAGQRFGHDREALLAVVAADLEHPLGGEVCVDADRAALGALVDEARLRALERHAVADELVTEPIERRAVVRSELAAERPRHARDGGAALAIGRDRVGGRARLELVAVVGALRSVVDEVRDLRGVVAASAGLRLRLHVLVLVAANLRAGVGADRGEGDLVRCPRRRAVHRGVGLGVVDLGEPVDAVADGDAAQRPLGNPAHRVLAAAPVSKQTVADAAHLVGSSCALSTTPMIESMPLASCESRTGAPLRNRSICTCFGSSESSS